MAPAVKPYHVKKRIKGNLIDFAILHDGDKIPYEVYDTEGEAKAVCEGLNTSPFASIVPPHINPQSAAQSAA